MKVIDKLGKTDAVTLAFAALPRGEIRVTSLLWPDGVVDLAMTPESRERLWKFRKIKT